MLYKRLTLLLGLLLGIISFVHAQQFTILDLSKYKSKNYAKRLLPSERLAKKKFTLIRRFFQNNFIHYNYYFYAKEDMNGILAKVKDQWVDTFTNLLPFYNYTLKQTAKYKSDWDSVAYICTSGILLHDLRSDWTDKMYLLYGRTFLYKNQVDTALQNFQYVNYAFAPKSQGYDIPIGSNVSKNKGQFSISTNESKQKYRWLYGRLPPARNESFLWIVRSYLEMADLSRAGALLQLLQNDIYFPKRLYPFLNEMLAYYNYLTKNYADAAHYLILALPQAHGVYEKARWNYLIAQLSVLGLMPNQASLYYKKAITHTNNIYMEIYARLGLLKIIDSSKTGTQYIQDNLVQLQKLARKERNKRYRDIIYYTMAQLSKEMGDDDSKMQYLFLSARYSTAMNPIQKVLTYTNIADDYYNRQDYTKAALYYDSIPLNGIANNVEKDRIVVRKKNLHIVVTNNQIIQSEDSLLALAEMPIRERDSLVRIALKAMRKKLKQEATEDDEQQNLLYSNNTNDNNNALLNNDNSGGVASFYFNNDNLKKNGLVQFNNTWGNISNNNFWAIQSRTTNNFLAQANVNNFSNNINGVKADVPKVTFASLIDQLPTTSDKKTKVYQAIATSLLGNGNVFMNAIEDYPQAIHYFKELVNRFDTSKYVPQALFSLYYLYRQSSQPHVTELLYIKSKLFTSYPNDSFTTQLRIALHQIAPPQTVLNDAYQKVYTHFIEGYFDTALVEAHALDSTFTHSNYWSPRLLYVKALYLIHTNMDSLAIEQCKKIIRTYSISPIADIAKNTIVVLKNKQRIIQYLDSTVIIKDEYVVRRLPDLYQPEVVVNQVDSVNTIKSAIDLLNQKNKSTVANALPTVIIGPFKYIPADNTLVGVILKKVDPVYQNEVRNAVDIYTRNQFIFRSFKVNLDTINKQNSVVVVSTFRSYAEALAFLVKMRNNIPATSFSWLDRSKYEFVLLSKENLKVLKESKEIEMYKQLLNKALPEIFSFKIDTTLSNNDSLKATFISKDATIFSVDMAYWQQRVKRISDSLALFVHIPQEYTFNIYDTQCVAIMFKNLDPTFLKESKNAVDRYMSNTLQSSYQIHVYSLNSDTAILTIESFRDGMDAKRFIKQINPLMKNSIIPWIDPQQYQMFFISKPDVQLLLQTRHISNYLLVQKALNGN